MSSATLIKKTNVPWIQASNLGKRGKRYEEGTSTTKSLRHNVPLQFSGMKTHFS